MNTKMRTRADDKLQKEYLENLAKSLAKDRPSPKEINTPQPQLQQQGQDQPKPQTQPQTKPEDHQHEMKEDLVFDSSTDQEEMEPGTAYELFGFRSVEPSSRPPILQLGAKSIPRVAWASRDCTHASMMLSRLRPRRPLEGAFFDKLELIRRIATSEVAKASTIMEAVAIVGIIMDREAILLGAEEILGQSAAKAKVLEVNPGNFEDLVAELAITRRPRTMVRRKENPFGVNRAKVDTVKSKPSQTYFFHHFRGGASNYYVQLGAPEKQNRNPVTIPRSDGTTGSMSAAWAAWKKWGAPRLITQWLRNGVPLVWKGAPPRPGWTKFGQGQMLKNKAAAKLEEEMKQLVEDGAFIIADNEEEVTLSPVFSIPKSSGGTRVIHDLRGINSRLVPPHFTLRGIRDAAEVVRHSKYLCALDLRRGYQQVLMDPASRKYLGTKVGTKTLVSSVLPFGLNISPYVFTRLTGWASRKAMELTGVSIATFIDDFMIGSQSREGLEDALKKILQLFSELGMVLSQKKEMTIEEEVDFLGFRWSAKTKTIRVTEEKRKKYKKEVKNLLRTPQPKARWRTVIGRLLFLKDAVAPALRRLRSCLKMITKMKDSTRIEAVGEVKEDLLWWLRTLESCPEISLERKPLSASIATDASNQGRGYVLEMQGLPRHKRQWTVEERNEHINKSELLAFSQAVKDNVEQLKGRRILWYVDNVTAAAVVKNQGSQHISAELWDAGKELLDMLENKGIDVVVRKVPGVLNTAADALSRPDLILDGWDKALATIVERWGPLQRDLSGLVQESQEHIGSLEWLGERVLLKPRIEDIQETFIEIIFYLGILPYSRAKCPLAAQVVFAAHLFLWNK